MRAARQRAKAATKPGPQPPTRRRAAEQRAQQAIADAADAEADAADAEAAAKEEKMKTAEAEANPDSIPSASGSSGTFVGATDAELEQLMQKATTPGSGVTPQHVKILAKANEQVGHRDQDPGRRQPLCPEPVPQPQDPDAGQQVHQDHGGEGEEGRSTGAAGSQCRQGGTHRCPDQVHPVPQAICSLRKRPCERRFAKEEIQARKKAALAARERPQGQGDRLPEAVRGDRQQAGGRIAQARAAEAGHRRAQGCQGKSQGAGVRGQAGGSLQAGRQDLAQVRGMQLGKAVRTTVTTRRERQNMQFAQAMAKRLRKNDPKAIRQYLVWKDAAPRATPTPSAACSGWPWREP